MKNEDARLALFTRVSVRAGSLFAALLCCGHLPAQSLAIRTSELPLAIKGVPYHAALAAAVSGECPAPDIGFAIVAGQLPKGLELFSFGIQGTTRQTGHFRFTVRAANACGKTKQTFDLFVSAKPLLKVYPPRVAFRSRSGGGAPPEQILCVQGSLPELPYSVEASGAPWLKAYPSNGETPDTESALTGDRVRLLADPSGLAPGTYRAALTFFTRGGENAPVVEVTLEVGKAE